jgi:hypothetical protein
MYLGTSGKVSQLQRGVGWPNCKTVVNGLRREHKRTLWAVVNYIVLELATASNYMYLRFVRVKLLPQTRCLASKHVTISG